MNEAHWQFTLFIFKVPPLSVRQGMIGFLLLDLQARVEECMPAPFINPQSLILRLKPGNFYLSKPLRKCETLSSPLFEFIEQSLEVLYLLLRAHLHLIAIQFASSNELGNALLERACSKAKLSNLGAKSCKTSARTDAFDNNTGHR